MVEILVGLLTFTLVMAIYNTALLISLKRKQTSLLAQEEAITELLLRIRLGAVKRKK